jgi:hypothetical protein
MIGTILVPMHEIIPPVDNVGGLYLGNIRAAMNI